MSLEITNVTKGPIQIVVRTKQGKGLSVKNIPGIGSGHNVYLLEDERHTDYIDRAVNAGQITLKKVITKR